MKNFLIILVFIVSIATIIVFVAGKKAGSFFEYETVVQFDVGKNLLWDIITDFDQYKNIKYGVINIEVHEYGNNFPISWTETYNWGLVKKYKVVEMKDDSVLALEIEENFPEMKTLLIFELEETTSNTLLKVSEKSSLENVFYAGIKSILGREFFVNWEIKWIRVGLYNYLLKR